MNVDVRNGSNLGICRIDEAVETATPAAAPDQPSCIVDGLAV